MRTRLLSSVFLILLAAAPSFLQAQDSSKIHLAVLPFVLSQGAQIGNPGDVVTIGDIVTTEFTNKTRFLVLDRSKFQKIIDELKIQTSAQFLNGQIVDQGKQIGAKFLVTGVVSEYKVSRSSKFNIKDPPHPIITFPCSLQMSFGVINVETGASLFTHDIEVVSNDIYSIDSISSSKRALTKMREEVNTQIRLILAGPIEIQQLGKMEKGVLKTIVTNGGGTVFTKGDKKAKVEVAISQKLAAGVRVVKIAELKSPDVQGDFVEWEVNKKEAQALSDAYNAKTPLVLTITK